MRRAALALAMAGTLGMHAPAALGSKGVVPGSFHAEARNRDGTLDVRAGSHPYEFKVSLEINHNAGNVPEGSARTVRATVPPGFVGNPTAVGRCPRVDFDGESANCPADSQIGIVRAQVFEPPGSLLEPQGPLYNLVPTAGAAASFGFQAAGFNVIENASLVPGGAGGYRVAVTAQVPKDDLLSAHETIWGVPFDPSHDAERDCIVGTKHVNPCSVEQAPAPFLTMPTNCEPQLPAQIEVAFNDAPTEFFGEAASQPQMGRVRSARLPAFDRGAPGNELRGDGDRPPGRSPHAAGRTRGRPRRG